MDRTSLWSTKKVIAGISNAFTLPPPRQEHAFNSARSRLKAMFGMTSQALHEPQRSENQAVSELTVRPSLLYPRP